MLISAIPPIRARKLRYYADRNFTARCLPASALASNGFADKPLRRHHDWRAQTRGTHERLERAWSELISADSGRIPDLSPDFSEFAGNEAGAGRDAALRAADVAANDVEDDDDLAPR